MPIYKYVSIHLGSVRNDGLEDRELEKYSSINETVAMVKSFQIERQLNHSRQYLPFNSGKRTQSIFYTVSSLGI